MLRPRHVHRFRARGTRRSSPMVMQQDELVMPRQATAEPQAASGQEQPPAALLARAEQMQAATNDVLQGRLDRWASIAAPVHSEAASTAAVSEAGTPITD